MLPLLLTLRTLDELYSLTPIFASPCHFIGKVCLYFVYTFSFIYTMFAYCNSYGEFGVPSPPVKVMAEVPDFRYITARTPYVIVSK